MRKKYGKRKFKRVFRKYRRTGKAKYLKKTIKRIAYSTQETKHNGLDVIAPFSVTNTWALNSIVSAYPAEGTSQSQRIGDTIKPISWKGTVGMNYGDTGGNSLRFVILRWLPDNAYDPVTAAKLFQTPAGANAYTSLYVEDNLGRNKFEVLHDRTYRLSSVAGPLTVKLSVPLKKKLKFPVATGNPIGGIIIWCAVSDSGGTPNPTIQWNGKMTFKDA